MYNIRQKFNAVINKLSFQKILRILIFSAICFVLFIYVFVIFAIMPAIREGESETNNVIISCENVVLSKLENIEKTAKTIAYNSGFIEYMQAWENIDIFNKQAEILEYVSDYCKTNTDIVAMIALDGMGKYRNLYGQTFYEINSNHKLWLEDCKTGQYMFIENSNSSEFDYCCYKWDVVSYKSFASTIGSLYIVFKTKPIQDVFDKLKFLNGGFIALVSGDTIVLSNGANIGEKFVLDKENCKFSESVKDNIKIVIVGDIVNFYIRNISHILFIITIVFVVFCVFCIILYIIFKYRIVLPIAELSNAMQNNNTYKSRIKAVNSEELNVIVNSANEMLETLEGQLHEIVYTQQRLYDVELQYQKSLIISMQSSINPHFMYNTLECIRSMAIVYKCEDIADICVSFAKFLRYSIKNEIYVTVDDEIESIRQYMEVMNIRYPGLIEVSYAIEEQALGLQCPKMIIQPIVENAVLHGIAESGRNGIINISIWVEENILHVKIADNGKGIEDTKLKKIVSQMLSDNAPKDCIGLFNVHKRIQLMCGDEYGLTVASEWFEGTEVTMKIAVKDLEA